MKKSIVLVNPFDELKSQIPDLNSSGAYGTWFAVHTKDWSAKQLGRFNMLHVEQIINYYDQVDQIVTANRVHQIIQTQAISDYNKGKMKQDAAWYQKMDEMMHKINQWGAADDYGQRATHMNSERKKFFKGFLSEIENQKFSAQHIWLFNTAHNEINFEKPMFSNLDTTSLDIVFNYSWSTDARAKALKQILGQAFEKEDTTLIAKILEKKFENNVKIGELLCQNRVKLKNKVQFLHDVLEIGVTVPVDVVPTLLQMENPNTDLVLKILRSAPLHESQKMVLIALPNVASSSPQFASELINDTNLTPNCLETLASFFGIEQFAHIFKCVDDDKKDNMLSDLCKIYMKKHKEPTLKKVGEFVQAVSAGFPSSEQKMVVLRMFALLVESKNNEIGAVLGSLVLEQVTSQSSTPSSKRKM